MTRDRRTLLGVGLLLVGSVAAGLVVLVPRVPVAAGVVVGLLCLGGGLVLVVGALRDRLRGMRLSVMGDPVLAEVVPARFGDDAVRAWDVLSLHASRGDVTVGLLHAAVQEADDVDDLVRRLEAGRT